MVDDECYENNKKKSGNDLSFIGKNVSALLCPAQYFLLSFRNYPCVLQGEQ